MREEVSRVDALEPFSWQFVCFVVDAELIPVGLQVIKSAGVHTVYYPKDIPEGAISSEVHHINDKEEHCQRPHQKQILDIVRRLVAASESSILLQLEKCEHLSYILILIIFEKII